VSLAAGQSRQFTANLGNQSVTWSVTPAVGVVSAGGVYTAPTFIGAAQMVVLSATVTGNPALSASTTITLTPALLTPQVSTLAPGQSQRFIAFGQNFSTAGPTWWLTPLAGSVARGGVYTAPASVASAAPVTIVSTSGGQNLAATITLIPSTPQLMGFKCVPGPWVTTCTITLSAPAGASGAPVQLSASPAGSSNAPASWLVPAGSVTSSFPVIVSAKGASLTATLGTSITASLQ
jgi:hypothetical protein